MRESATVQLFIDEGRRDGHLRGELEEARNLLFALGRKAGFGEPPESLRQTILAMSDKPRVEALALRVMDIKSWNELLD